MNCDVSRKKLEEFQNVYEEYKEKDLSESDTRSKIIDYILIEILGWLETDIQREGHVDSGYYDYKISLSGINIVVEAKRQFKEFILPNQSKKSCSLKSIYNENKEVVNQIRGYLDDIGCDTGIITNGKQFIIAKFRNNDGTSWKDNKCLFFDGIEDILNRFVEFWNNLSRESVILNRGIKSLRYVDLTFSKTIYSTIPEKDKEITRNGLAAELQPIINSIFGEIYKNENDSNDIDFIRECYVENEEVKKNKSELNKLFPDKAPALDRVIPIANHPKVKQRIIDEINQSKSDSCSAPTPQPIIIIGSKGVGKTTFINHLFIEEYPSDTISKYPYVYINVMKYYSDRESIDFDVISKDTISLLDEKYPDYQINELDKLRRIYSSDIKNKEKNIWSFYQKDSSEYNEALQEFLKEKLQKSQDHLKAINLYFTKEIHRRIILVFDNADQLNDSIQEQLFLFAASLNKNAKFGVIISLREGYYYKWRNSSPFNAFESNVYHITTPDYGIVLQKRIDYAIKKIREEKFEPTIRGEYGNKNWQIGAQQIEEFLTSVKNSIFSENTSILDFINHTTYPNIREGLHLVKKFLTSGYTDVSEYILRTIYSTTSDRGKIIPIHEFAQTIGLENKLYYNHSISEIVNLFYPQKNTSDYFIKFYILYYLNDIKDNQRQAGTVGINSMLDDFYKFGYDKTIVQEELYFLVDKGLVETGVLASDIRKSDIELNDIDVYISAKGRFYIEHIINKFYYLDMVVQDTPILKEEDFNEIRSVFPERDEKAKRDLSQRLSVVTKFMSYLERVEKEQVSNHAKEKYGYVTNNIKVYGLNAEIDRINKVINANNQ